MSINVKLNKSTAVYFLEELKTKLVESKKTRDDFDKIIDEAELEIIELEKALNGYAMPENNGNNELIEEDPIEETPPAPIPEKYSAKWKMGEKIKFVLRGNPPMTSAEVAEAVMAYEPTLGGKKLGATMKTVSSLLSQGMNKTYVPVANDIHGGRRKYTLF